MVKIIFLGNAGGRMATYNQLGYTGGFIIEDELKIHIDPGPGALLLAYKHKLDPKLFDGVLVSHCHPDHYNDAEVIIEAITRGCNTKKGFLIGSESVIYGNDDFNSPISRYHQKKLKDVYVLKPDDNLEIKGINIKATKSIHGDQKAIGFRFQFRKKSISYITDTEYFKDLYNYHKNVDLLILTLTRPKNLKLRGHMCTEEAIELLKEIKPKKTIITHFGAKMYQANPKLEAEYIEKKTNIKTKTAEVGKVIEI